MLEKLISSSIGDVRENKLLKDEANVSAREVLGGDTSLVVEDDRLRFALL